MQFTNDPGRQHWESHSASASTADNMRVCVAQCFGRVEIRAGCFGSRLGLYFTPAEARALAAELLAAADAQPVQEVA